MVVSGNSPGNLNLIEKGSLVEALWHSVDDAAGNLENVPGLVKRVIDTEAWRERVCRGKTYRHKRFIDFITTQPLAGCGWSPEKVEALIRDDAEILALWRGATTAAKGTNQYTKVDSDNITIQSERGTSRAYILTRLKRDHPDLFEQVKQHKLSANRAAIKAGFRKSTVPLARLKAAWEAADQDERKQFLTWIMKA